MLRSPRSATVTRSFLHDFCRQRKIQAERSRYGKSTIKKYWTPCRTTKMHTGIPEFESFPPAYLRVEGPLKTNENQVKQNQHTVAAGLMLYCTTLHVYSRQGLLRSNVLLPVCVCVLQFFFVIGLCVRKHGKKIVSELMARIQARYMSGGTVKLAPCATINDVRVDVARRHNKFAPDVAVTSADYDTVFIDDDAVPPAEVAIVLKEEPYDEKRWQLAITAHARAHDVCGVRRAVHKVVECGKYGSGAAFCSQVLCDVLRTREGDIDVGCASVFLECGADVNYIDVTGCRALARAAQGGNAHLVRALIAAAADVNHVSRGGFETALIVSAWQGHVDVTRTLIAATANINHVQSDGNTALTTSASYGFTSIVHMLLNASADVNHAGMEDNNILLNSIELGYTDVACALIAAGAKTNNVSTNGMTPLLSSIMNNHVDTVRALLAAAANVNLSVGNALTPVEHALHQGDADMTRLLLNASAEVDQSTAKQNASLVGDALWFPLAQMVSWLTESFSNALRP